MLTHTFTVRRDENAPEHEISVEIPSFAEASEAQREVMWNEGVTSVTIKVQATARRRLAKGKRGEALVADCQAAFDAILNGSSRARPVIVLKRSDGFTDEQVALMASSNPGIDFRLID